MRDDLVLDLADCTEFRQTLQARPPGIVHGTLVLLVALIGTALGWSVVTRATLVVQGSGRIRPVTTPVQVYSAARGEALSASVGGRVVEVNFHEGDQVKRGEVLIRLETGRLDNEVARQARLIRTGEEESAQLDRLATAQARQFEAARARAEAELAHASTAVDRAGEQQAVEIRLARLALSAAEQGEETARKLSERKAAPPAELASARVKTHEAREQLARARIPVDASGVAVARRALEQTERDYVVTRDELELKRKAKSGEIAAARLELANLELERAQAVIRSPIDGVVTAGDLKVGDLLEPGKSAVAIARQAGFLFEASIPSEEIAHVRVGMQARIRLDAYDYQRYGTLDGTVGFVSPDSGMAEGQTSALYTVRIATSRNEIGRGAYRGPVKLGMTGQVEIVTGRDRLLTLLVGRLRQTISLN
jgi:multidrug resistance efflux pump